MVDYEIWLISSKDAQGFLVYRTYSVENPVFDTIGEDFILSGFEKKVVDKKLSYAFKVKKIKTK